MRIKKASLNIKCINPLVELLVQSVILYIFLNPVVIATSSKKYLLFFLLKKTKQTLAENIYTSEQGDTVLSEFIPKPMLASSLASCDK